VVGGSHEYLLGDPPTSLEDPQPEVNHQGFVAKYSSGGSMVASLYTGHDEVSALWELGDGRLLIAGRDRLIGAKPSDARALLVKRARIWEIDDESGASQDLPYFDLDGKYGNAQDEGGPAGALMRFFDSDGECDVLRVPAITATSDRRYTIAAAELRCRGGRRIGLAALDQDGRPIASFGSGGMKVLAGPHEADAIPVGVAPKESLFSLWVVKQRWIWLGAALGNGCGGGGEEDCGFALTRFDALSGSLDSKGWYVPDLVNSDTTGVRPWDMALDASGRPVMAGTAWSGSDRHVAVHRFTSTGKSDASFGISGWSTPWFQAHQGDARGVWPSSDGGIGLAIRSVEETAGGETLSLAMMKLSASGATLWTDSPYYDYFAHGDVKSSLDYGTFYEDRMASAPSAGIVEDWAGRFVLVGAAASLALVNPCAEIAHELAEPFLDYGTLCGGAKSIALARYLPFGEPDSRRWVAPGESRMIRMPEDRDLGSTAPPIANVRLSFNGYADVHLFFELVEFSHAIADAPTESFGSYPFPFAPSVLAYGERFLIKTHTLDHHHRNSEGNRFAYDISIVRWTGDGWTVKVEQPDPEGPGNQDYLVWKRPVRAVVDGQVVACRRSAPDNIPGDFAPDSNFVTIQHTFDAFDSSQVEYLTYVHFAEDTVPLEVCPNVCPSDEPCDPETEGVDPDGAELEVPVPVSAGQIVGYAGNSGNSSSPHLHIHMTTGADDEEGPNAGSYPLLFHSVSLQDDGNPDGAALYPVLGRALAHNTLAHPTQ
jgi:hypothetical protein